eukprot:188546-Ditylum_brightwellii.AAC.1
MAGLKTNRTDLTLSILALFCLAMYVGLNQTLKQSKIEAREQAERRKTSSMMLQATVWPKASESGHNSFDSEQETRP